MFLLWRVAVCGARCGGLMQPGWDLGVDEHGVEGRAVDAVHAVEGHAVDAVEGHAVDAVDAVEGHGVEGHAVDGRAVVYQSASLTDLLRRSAAGPLSSVFGTRMQQALLCSPIEQCVVQECNRRSSAAQLSSVWYKNEAGAPLQAH